MYTQAEFSKLRALAITKITDYILDHRTISHSEKERALEIIARAEQSKG